MLTKSKSAPSLLETIPNTYKLGENFKYKLGENFKYMLNFKHKYLYIF